MRTTITVADDVAARIESLLDEGSVSKKELYNELLRRGLDDLSRKTPRRTFSTSASALGACYVNQMDDISEVLAVAEGEDYR